MKRFDLAGVVATNTTIARRDLSTPAARVEAIGAGGLSGPPVKARARAMVTMARQALGAHAAIIGVGGVETIDDVEALRKAGRQPRPDLHRLDLRRPRPPGRAGARALDAARLTTTPTSRQSVQALASSVVTPSASPQGLAETSAGVPVQFFCTFSVWSSVATSAPVVRS